MRCVTGLGRSGIFQPLPKWKCVPKPSKEISFLLLPCTLKVNNFRYNLSLVVDRNFRYFGCITCEPKGPISKFKILLMASCDGRVVKARD